MEMLSVFSNLRRFFNRPFHLKIFRNLPNNGYHRIPCRKTRRLVPFLAPKAELRKFQLNFRLSFGVFVAPTLSTDAPQKKKTRLLVGLPLDRLFPRCLDRHCEIPRVSQTDRKTEFIAPPKNFRPESLEARRFKNPQAKNGRLFPSHVKLMK